jgi:hypothetical protein
LVFQTVDSVDPKQTSAGAGVAGVLVTATGLHMGRKVSARTGADGTYSFANLAADTYQVAIPQLPRGFWGFNGQSLSAQVVLASSQTFGDLNFGLTPRTTAVVQNLYERVLMRSADAKGLAGWVSRLNNNSTTIGQAFAGFLNSTEFKSDVLPLAEMLGVFFPGKPVDPDLLRHNAQLIQEGITPDAAVLSALYSQTFVSQFGDTSKLSNTAFVTFLYRKLLHRSPDRPGLALWVGRLDSGTVNRGQAVLGFIAAPEFLRANPTIRNTVTVSMAYLGLLGRPAGQAGYQYWMTRLNSGQVTTAGMGDAFVASGEFRRLRGYPDVFLSDIEAQPIDPEVSLLNRVEMYNPAIGHQTFDLDVTPGSISGRGSNGQPVDLYIFAHGWAPSFLEDVLLHSTPGNPLHVWDTVNFPGPQGPDSAYLFNGVDQVSVTGLAKAITQADPNAVILLYSWLDQSATPDTSGLSTTDPLPALLAAQSESYTQLNGLRMAGAIRAALNTNFFPQGGLLHLMGESHGSKVATVAALALQQDGVPVAQLTTFESPEAGPSPLFTIDYVGIGFSLQDFPGLLGAQNFNWFYMQQMNVNANTKVVTSDRSPVAPAPGQIAYQFPTYIDNYFSQDGFGMPLGGMQPFTGVLPNPQSLSPVADVALHPEVLYPLPTSFSDPSAALQQLLQTAFGSHEYPPPWYAQASLSPPPAPDAAAGLAWSPLLSSSPAAGGPGWYNQTWTSNIFSQQFTLSRPTAPPTYTPVAAPFQYATVYQIGSVTNDGIGTITLGAGPNAAPLSVLATTFTPLANVPQSGEYSYLSGTGLSFQFQFHNPSPGDQLVVWARGQFNLRVPPVSLGNFAGFNSGTLGYQTVPLFTMTAEDAGTTAQLATIPLDLFASHNSFDANGNLVEGALNATQQPILGFSLIHVVGGQSSVTVTAMHQFTDGTTGQLSMPL